MSNKGNQHNVTERFLRSLFAIMEAVKDDMENASYCFDFNQIDEESQLNLLDYLKSVGCIDDGDFEGFSNSYKIAEAVGRSVDSEAFRCWNLDNELRLFHYDDGVLHGYYVGIDNIEPNLDFGVAISLKEVEEYMESLSSEFNLRYHL